MGALLHQPDADEIQALRARVADLEATVASRDAELARTQDELDAFKARYRQAVGDLYEQLDELEHAIAEVELGELASQIGDSQRRSGPTEPAQPAPPAAARLTSDSIRKLFRDVAKAIHPDLTHDERARTRRQTLMAEANRAYADGDEEQLRLILAAWQQSPEAVQGTDPAAMRLRLTRRAAQLEERLASLERGFADMRALPLWQLKAKVDEAAAAGRDLLGDLLARLRRDILVARNRLEAMRPPAPRR